MLVPTSTSYIFFPLLFTYKTSFLPPSSPSIYHRCYLTIYGTYLIHISSILLIYIFNFDLLSFIIYPPSLWFLKYLRVLCMPLLFTSVFSTVHSFPVSLNLTHFCSPLFLHSVVYLIHSAFPPQSVFATTFFFHSSYLNLRPVSSSSFIHSNLSHFAPASFLFSLFSLSFFGASVLSPFLHSLLPFSINVIHFLFSSPSFSKFSLYSPPTVSFSFHSVNSIHC